MIRPTMADFEEKKQRVAEQYSRLTDEELQALAGEAWSLTEPAKQALITELSRRALEIDLAANPPAQLPPPNLVTLRTFTDVPEALLAKTALDSAGIESFLIDETTIRMDWLWSNALGGIKLCVTPDDAKTAAQLLDQGIPENFDVEGVGNFEQPLCPQCQSLDISCRDLDKRTAYAGIVLLGLPISLKHRRWKCQTCSYEWQSSDEPKQESSGG
jgi:hypothetical protein